MAAPTFISATTISGASTATTQTTGSISVTNGDVLVALIGAEAGDFTNIASITISTASGSTSVWTSQQEFPTSNNTNQGYVRAFTATATATGTITVSITKKTANGHMGLILTVWRGGNGIGNSNVGQNGTSTGAPTVSVTASVNSALAYLNVDWTASSGTVTFTASDGSPVQDLADQSLAGSSYCIYGSHVVDVGSAASKSMGMSSPSAQRYVSVVVEVLGTASAVTWLPAPYDSSSVIMESFYNETIIGY